MGARGYARRAYANDRKVAVIQFGSWPGQREQAAFPQAKTEKIVEIRLEDRALSRVYLPAFGFAGVESDDLMSLADQAPGGRQPNIAKAEDGNFHHAAN
jgi:hypothetical protein